MFTVLEMSNTTRPKAEPKYVTYDYFQQQLKSIDNATKQYTRNYINNTVSAIQSNVVNYSALSNQSKSLTDGVRTIDFDPITQSIQFRTNINQTTTPIKIHPITNTINNVSKINFNDNSTITGITSDSSNTDPTKAISANILTDLNSRFTALETKTQNQTATGNETTFTGNVTADTFNGFHLGMNGRFYTTPAVPVINNDLVMEVGRYIDFHYNNSTNTDYKSRISISKLGTLHYDHSLIVGGGDIKARNCIADGGDLNNIASRTKSLETKNTEQDTRLDALESKDVAHEERLGSIEAMDTAQNESINNINTKNAEQDTRLDTLESKNTEQDTRLDALESKDVAHEERLGSIEAMDTAQNESINNINTKNNEQDTRLDTLESKNTEQDERIVSIEVMNTAQNETLSIINTKNNEQDTRLDTLEIINTEQDTRLDTLDRKDLEQDTRLDTLESNQITLTMKKNERITYNILGTASFANNIFTFVFEEQPTTGSINFVGDFFDGNETHPCDFTMYFTNGAYSKMEIVYWNGFLADVFQGEYNSTTLTFKLFGNNGNQALNSFDESTLSIHMPNEKDITRSQDIKSLNILSEDLADNNVYSASKLLDIIYPIGSIYLTFNQSPPAIGTWELLSPGYFLQSTTSSPGETGGSTTHSHKTSGHVLTAGEMPVHKHTFTGNKITGTVYDIMKYDTTGQTNKDPSGAFSVNRYGSRTSQGTDASKRAFSLTFEATPTGSISSEGKNQAHNHGNTEAEYHIPPYITCFMYKRTA